MTQTISRRRFSHFLLGATIAFLALISNVAAQEQKALDTNVSEAKAVVYDDAARTRLELEELSGAIEEKSRTLKDLKRKVDTPGSEPEIEVEIDIIKQQLETLNKSFEQIAIGSINLDILGLEEQPKTWQEELTLVVKPLLENLRSLTERPRRQENLRQMIEVEKETAVQAELAIQSINNLLADEPSNGQRSLLKEVQDRWLRTKQDAQRQEQLALYQLNSLSGEGEHWWTSLKDSMLHFFQDRGLTLLMAIVASLTIWLLLSGTRKVFERRGRSSTKHGNRTTYRVIAYAQKLLTALLIMAAVLTVFFIRGDILLLVVTLALLFASALSLKNLLPLFVAESRLLLNIGAVREHEQVMIDGVPWRVASLNVYSKFSNPDIQGTLRLPLASLKEMTSRPIKEEKWFPSSIGDWVLDNDQNLYEVIKQTPVVVELQSARGTNKLVPTADYFAAGMVNLTKSKQIRIISRFGIGYELQAICLDEVPETFQRFVKSHLESAGLDTKQIDVRVEFDKAGDSSLDYIVIALLGSQASKYFYRIERTIQQACVAACIEKGWEIPFPQLTIHQSPTK